MAVGFAKIVAVAALFFIVFVSFVKSELRCYDCNVLDEGNCTDPIKYNTVSKPCASDRTDSRSVLKRKVDTIAKSDVETRGQPLNFTCFSMYFNSSDANLPSGIYRGCTEISNDIQDACDFLQEELKVNGTVKKCKSCVTDNCNTYEIRGTGSAVNLMPVSLAMVFFNALICFYVIL